MGWARPGEPGEPCGEEVFWFAGNAAAFTFFPNIPFLEIIPWPGAKPVEKSDREFA